MPFISRSAGVRTWTLSAALALSAVLSPIPAGAQDPPAATPAPAPDSEEQNLLARANKAAAAGDLEQADLAYHLFLTSYPKSLLRDQVYFGLAQIDQQQQNNADAASLYQNLLSEFPDSPLSGPARHQLAEVYISLGQYDGAISALELERNLTRDPISRDALTNRIVDVYLLKKDRVQAVIMLQKQAGGRDEENRAIEDRIQQLLDQSSKGELEELVRRFPKGFPGDAALLRLADLHESAREYFEADRELRRFLSIYPKHRAVPAVRSKILSIRQVEMSHRYLIGALLPMSGRLKPFGQQVLNGIRLAMDSITGIAPEKSVGLVIKDTEGDASALQGGLEELLREYRVIAIIGPLLSRQVVAAAPRSESYRVPLLTPSASEPWSKSWKYILRNSITNQQQAREIADYAVNTLNERRFCILFSNDAYGGEMMRAFTEEVGKLGGEIIARASYDLDATDFGPQIKYLKETDLAKYGVLGPPPEQKGELREYKPGFDGIFIPGDYNQVGLIAPQLAFYNIQGVTMLGTNGWDSPDLFRIGGKYVDGGIFVDGFYPASSDPAVRSFVDRYRNRFNEEPSLLAAQAYDTASLILKSIQQGASSGETIREFVSRIQNFPGATGSINFTPEGDLAKRLYVIQAKDGKFVQIK
jgi:ABC-type branched-subunit amino acid transport system substrate-binding protein/predicted negative regulator of RcsB-dependent stress response